MTTTRMGVLVAALLTAAAPAAFAQSHMTAVPTPPQTVAGTIGPNQMRASKVIGMDVYGKYNQQIGSVQDIVLNRNGTVAAVVVSANGKNVGVPLSDFTSNHNRLTLTNISKAELNGAAPYHLTDKNTGAGTTGSPVNGGQLGSSAGK